MGSALTILPDTLIVGSFFINALIHTYFHVTLAVSHLILVTFKKCTVQCT